MTNALTIAGGYLVLAARGCPTVKVPVRTSEEAVAAWLKYRDGNGIGASDMKRRCGDVCDNGGKVIARISYNARIWDADGNLLSEATA